MRSRSKLSLLSAAAMAAFLPTKGWAAVTADEFQLRSTADLVALCSAQPNDPMLTAALNFCHGFAVGVTRLLQEEDADRPNKKPMFCLPGTTPNRNQAVSDFVNWASASPARMSTPATDGLAEYLASAFPCRS